jgi:uncharacterized protein (TIGR02996 family)
MMLNVPGLVSEWALRWAVFRDPLDPDKWFAYADWLREHGRPEDEAQPQQLGQAAAALSSWSRQNLPRRLAQANGWHRTHLLTLLECLQPAAHLDMSSAGWILRDAGGAAGLTTVCLAVRKLDGTIAVDAGAAQLHTSVPSVATAWPTELAGWRAGAMPLEEELRRWAERR